MCFVTIYAGHLTRKQEGSMGYAFQSEVHRLCELVDTSRFGISVILNMVGDLYFVRCLNLDQCIHPRIRITHL